MSAGVLSSFEERQQILDNEVASQVGHRTDNHQHKGEPHPQRSRFSRLHRWFPQPITSKREQAARARTISHSRPAEPISRRRRLFRKAVTQTVLNLGPTMGSAGALRRRCGFHALKRRRGARFASPGSFKALQRIASAIRTMIVRSSESDADIQAARRQKQRHDQACSGKHDQNLESFDIALSRWKPARENPYDGSHWRSKAPPQEWGRFGDASSARTKFL
jgi:hypothetical protein